MKMNHDVFISYSSQNRDAAQAICHVLEQNEIRCWIAPRDIPGGSQYGDVIESAIKSSKVIVVLFSETAASSPWVSGELNVAFEEQKTIIPFRLDQTPLKGQNRVMLNQRHWIDAYPDYKTKFSDLVLAVSQATGREKTDADIVTPKPATAPQPNGPFAPQQQQYGTVGRQPVSPFAPNGAPAQPAYAQNTQSPYGQRPAQPVYAQASQPAYPPAGGGGAKRSGIALWKIIVPAAALLVLLIVGGILLFGSSAEEKAAEAARADYLERIEDCRTAMRDADSFSELKEAEDLLDELEIIERRYAAAMPSVFNKCDELNEYLAEMKQKQRREYVQLARQCKSDGDYRLAYDLYRTASESLPNDEELRRYMAELEPDLGYIYVTRMEYSNSEEDGTDIDEAGTTLYANRMRYLFPKVVYNSLLPEGEEVTRINLTYKIITPDGTLKSGSTSPAGYTTSTSILIAVGEEDQGEWLSGWGNANESTYSAGTYTFQLFYEGHQIYEEEFELH